MKVRAFLGVLTVILLGASTVRSEWKEVRTANWPFRLTLSDAKIVVGGKDNIWALAGIQKDASTKDFYLFKWDQDKNAWSRHAFVAQNLGNFLNTKMAISPEGAVFVVEKARLTADSKKAYDEKLPAAQQAQREAHYPIYKAWLEKLVAEGKSDKNIIGLWNKSLKGTQEEKNKFSEAIGKLNLDYYKDIIPMNKTLNKAMSEAFDKVMANVKKVYTTPAYKFVNGQLVQKYDFVGDKTPIVAIAALNNNEFLRLKIKHEKVADIVGATKQENWAAESFVEKWDGTSWKPFGRKIYGTFHKIHVGIDGSVFLEGSIPTVVAIIAGAQATEIKEDLTRLFKWDGSAWQPLNIKVGTDYKINRVNIKVGTDYKINRALFVGAENNIWLYMVSKRTNAAGIYKWDGQKLEAKGPSMSIRAWYAGPGNILVQVQNGKLYKWVE